MVVGKGDQQTWRVFLYLAEVAIEAI